MTIQNTLKDLVSIKSLSSDALMCKSLLKKLSKVVPKSKYLNTSSILIWGHTDLRTSKWLINTHIDVVPGKENQFSLEVHGDRANGRGAADTKGSVAVLVCKAHEWHRVAQEKGITLMLVSDEEIGGDSTKKIIKSMNNLKGAIFLEPTNLQIVTEAKGMMQIKITSTGVSTHGSRPWDGDNAIERLMRELIQFRLTHPSPSVETKDSTYNFSLINGGNAINQVPSRAELWCDIRFNPAVDPDQIVTLMNDTFKSCDVTVVKKESPILCDRNTRVFQMLNKSLKANSINPITKFDHGTSDARHATALGIPALVIGPKGSGLHSDNEWVSLKSLERLSCILDHWINNI